MTTFEQLVRIRQFGVANITQVLVLGTLLRGKADMGSLALAVGVSSAAATGACDRLIHFRLIRRDLTSRDRRRVIVSLTEAGRELVEGLFS